MTDINTQITDIRNKLSDITADDKLYPYVLFKISSNIYGINCRYIVSIEKYMKIIETVNQSADLRGVSEYKEEVINLVDMRSVFGLPSSKEEVLAMSDIRKYIDEHIQNETRLYNNAKANKTTNLTSDPKKCSFGEWFERFKKSEALIGHGIAQIEYTHTQFHKNAVEIDRLILKGEYEEAIKIAETIKHNSFETIRENLIPLEQVMLDRIQELVIILGRGKKKCGIIVDSVETVEDIVNPQELPKNTQCSKYIKRLGMRSKNDDIILLMEHEAFFDD